MYSVLYDNNHHHYVVMEKRDADKYLRLLNMQELSTHEEDYEAYAAVQGLMEEEAKKRKDYIRSFNIKKAKAREEYNSMMWDDDPMFYLVLNVQFKAKMNMTYSQAFKSQLDATSYMRRLFWYLYDEKSRTAEELDMLTYTTEAFMEKMCPGNKKTSPQQLWKILSNFTDIVALLPNKHPMEEYRIDMVRHLILKNNAEIAEKEREANGSID